MSTRKPRRMSADQIEAAEEAEIAAIERKQIQQVIGVRLQAFHDLLSTMLEELAADIASWMTHQGFLITNDAESIALMHSELSEALEAMRHNRWDGKDCVGEELADTVIRILHFCGVKGIDLGDLIVQKMHANLQRPSKHGKEF